MFIFRLLSSYSTHKFPHLFTIYLLYIEKPLQVIVTYIFDRMDYYSTLSLSRGSLCRFLHFLEGGYLDIPYHNNLHAADVVHNMFWMFQSTNLTNALTKRDMAVALIAGAMHDFGNINITHNFSIIKLTPNSCLYSYTCI